MRTMLKQKYENYKDVSIEHLQMFARSKWGIIHGFVYDQEVFLTLLNCSGIITIMQVKVTFNKSDLLDMKRSIIKMIGNSSEMSSDLVWHLAYETKNHYK